MPFTNENGWHPSRLTGKAIIHMYTYMYTYYLCPSQQTKGRRYYHLSTYATLGISSTSLCSQEYRYNLIITLHSSIDPPYWPLHNSKAWKPLNLNTLKEKPIALTNPDATSQPPQHSDVPKTPKHIEPIHNCKHLKSQYTLNHPRQII